MYVTCFTIYEQVCMWHVLPCMNKCVCDMLYHVWTSAYVTCITMYEQVVCDMLYHVWTSAYVTCFTMYGPVGL